ncbi:GDSL esterase/lipase [Hibiscus syriacus]|uniref:GDSL esterase/lipase n=1 Tax=Hibiscus syriacus TaxID=106335 RepID=A0A6A2ZPB4_HIBSY|nr:GDSL esterase/lipase [Hibiscus syriacus]
MAMHGLPKFHAFFLKNNDRRRLRKVVSDVSWEIGKYIDTALESSSSTSTILEEDEVVVKQAECECCGLKEDCTADYIARVKGRHCGRWVCGLCYEAVKERLNGAPPTAAAAMEKAVSSHREFCQNFNSTTRLNPKLSLTCAMRDIAKRSHETRRSSTSLVASKIGRSTSCVPKIDLNKHSLV